MITQDFEKHYQELKNHIEDLLIIKAKEYAQPNGDRLWNFKQATSLLGTNQARTAFYYCTKHYDSLAKITEDLDKEIYPSLDLIREKCGDIIAYTYLIYACLIEELQNHETTPTKK